MKSFIVEFWSKIFYGLRLVSLFQLIRVVFPKTKRSYGFVDIWVLGNSIFSFLCLAVLSIPQIRCLEIVVLCYAGVRIFEVIIYQINVLLFDEYRAKKAGREYAVGGFRRIVLLLFHNYIEIFCWFALFYRHLAFLFESRHISLNSLGGSLYFSLVTMSTLGYGDIVPQERAGLFLVFMQTSIGIFMALLILARFISLIPDPESLDELEKR
ncbi:MAG: two pore domain potassium channel family protein [Phycisphaerae bacterium]|nr:two pore domain potassium channel family protein [Phycisphaerae bacterium]